MALSISFSRDFFERDDCEPEDSTASVRVPLSISFSRDFFEREYEEIQKAAFIVAYFLSLFQEISLKGGSRGEHKADRNTATHPGFLSLFQEISLKEEKSQYSNRQTG